MRRLLGAVFCLMALGCGGREGSAPSGMEALPPLHDEGGEESTERFQKLYNSGLLFYHLDEFQKAEKALRDAVRLRGADPKPFFYLGRTYLKQKRFSKAEEALREVLRRDPSFTAASLLLAEVYFQSQRLEEGMKHIEKLLETQEGTPEVYFYLGWIRERQNQLADAVEAYQELLRRDPSHVEGRFHLGLARMKMGSLERAREAFEAVLRQDPEHMGSHFHLGKVYKGLAMEVERGESLERFQELVARKNEQIYRTTKVAYYSNRGITYYNSGEFEPAIREFQTVVELNPELARGYYYLGMCYISMQRPVEALEHLERALELDPEDEQILVEMGRAHALKGDLPEAVEAFREAIHRNPYIDMPHFYLAGIYQRQNLAEPSRRHLAEFRRLRNLATETLPVGN